MHEFLGMTGTQGSMAMTNNLSSIMKDSLHYIAYSSGDELHD